MIEESKCYNGVMKKHFNKKLAMTKKDYKDFKNFTKCWICDNAYIKGDVKVRGHCDITGKYRSSAIKIYKIKLRHTIPAVFHN